MEVTVIKDTRPGLYSDLNPEPTAIVFLAKMWVFLGLWLLNVIYLSLFECLKNSTLGISITTPDHFKKFGDLSKPPTLLQ